MGEATKKAFAAIPPKVTAVTLVKFVPVIVTRSPPIVDPVFTLSAVTVGRAPAAVTVNWSMGDTVEVPVGVVMVTSIGEVGTVLQAGVTSAFDAATVNNVAQSVRDAIDADMYEGPRMAVSGRQLTNHQGLEDSFPNEDRKSTRLNSSH